MCQAYTKEALIAKLLAIRGRGWIESGRNKNNAGAIGNTLEDLLGISENNLPIPNAAEWELKTQKKNTSALLTLFHTEPSPRGLKIVPYLLEKYGWVHEQAGSKYPETEKSFRQTLTYQQRTSRGFFLDIDEANRRITVNFSFDTVSDSYIEWKASLVKRGSVILDTRYTPYWGFDDVFHKAGVKLGNCFFVVADSKTENGKLFVRYEDIKMLSCFDLDNFLDAIRCKYILVDFDARTGHNHGTKFRIKPEAIPLLYKNVQEF